MVFHENRLLANDSNETLYLIFSTIRRDVAKFVVLALLRLTREKTPLSIYEQDDHCKNKR